MARTFPPIPCMSVRGDKVHLRDCRRAPKTLCGVRAVRNLRGIITETWCSHCSREAARMEAMR